VLVLHVPLMLGSVAGLLLLEDRDAGLLPALGTAPGALATMLAHRLAATATLAASAVGGGLLLTGAGHPAGVVGLLATAVACGAVSTVPALLMGALGRDRAQGIALMKVLGVPLYAPLAWWYVGGPLGWLFALVPTGWVVRASWTASPLAATGLAAGGTAASLLVGALALRRLRRSLVA
jgi:hypothetical protein